MCVWMGLFDTREQRWVPCQGKCSDQKTPGAPCKYKKTPYNTKISCWLKICPMVVVAPQTPDKKKRNLLSSKRFAHWCLIFFFHLGFCSLRSKAPCWENHVVTVKNPSCITYSTGSQGAPWKSSNLAPSIHLCVKVKSVYSGQCPETDCNGLNEQSR